MRTRCPCPPFLAKRIQCAIRSWLAPRCRIAPPACPCPKSPNGIQCRMPTWLGLGRELPPPPLGGRPAPLPPWPLCALRPRHLGRIRRALLPALPSACGFMFGKPHFGSAFGAFAGFPRPAPCGFLHRPAPAPALAVMRPALAPAQLPAPACPACYALSPMLHLREIAFRLCFRGFCSLPSGCGLGLRADSWLCVCCAHRLPANPAACHLPAHG